MVIMWVEIDISYFDRIVNVTCKTETVGDNFMHISNTFFHHCTSQSNLSIGATKHGQWCMAGGGCVSRARPVPGRYKMRSSRDTAAAAAAAKFNFGSCLSGAGRWLAAGGAAVPWLPDLKLRSLWPSTLPEIARH